MQAALAAGRNLLNRPPRRCACPRLLTAHPRQHPPAAGIKDKAFQQTAMLTKRVKSGVKSAGSAAVGTTGVTKLAGDSAEAGEA